jgi:Domain of unknown function (DUF222)/HNH endonuclease
MEAAIADHISAAAAALTSAHRCLRSGASANPAIVVALRALVDQADIVCTRSIAEFAGQSVAQDEGFRNVSEWFAANAKAGAMEGQRRIEHADLLNKLRWWSAAIDNGTVGMIHLAALSNAATRPRMPLLLRDEQMLLGFAEQLTFNQFRRALSAWASMSDDALADPTNEKQHEEQRRVQLTELTNGMWHLNGLLDPLSGETLRTALEAATAKPGEGDNRTLAQRRHDALNDIALESLANSERPTVGGERPHVTVIVDAASGIAHTSQMLPISSFTRDLLLCDCVTTSVWLGANGTPFDVGTPTSSIPIRNRRAVLARDKCCRMPGCDRPARWTDIHHIRERTNGGAHQLQNLVALCRFHHRYVHKNKLKLRWDLDRITLIVEWPNGHLANDPPLPRLFPNPPPV